MSDTINVQIDQVGVPPINVAIDESAPGPPGPPGPNTIQGLFVQGTNVTLSGTGTLADPYVISATGELGGTVAWGDVTEKPAWTGTFDGSYGSLSGLPTLFDGAYSSLSGIPATFPPSAHTHPASAITDFDAAVAANSTVTANSAKITNATHTGEVTGATDLTITAGSITDAKVNAAAAIAESKLSLASDAAAGTASRRTLGTGATQAAAGNHGHAQLHDRSHAMTDSDNHVAGEWKLFYSSGLGEVVELPLGADDTYLKSNGPTAIPSFEAVVGGGGGTVTSVAISGTGLSVTGSPITTSGTFGLAVIYGTTAGTSCQGNDSRLSDARAPTTHTHAASAIVTGTIATARLASGTASSSTFLRGDQTWQEIAAGGVTSVTGTAPIASTGGSTPDISISAATTDDPGSMSAADKIKLDGIAASANNYTHPNHTGDVTSDTDGEQTIANGAVTEAKCNASINASLDLADSALQDAHNSAADAHGVRLPPTPVGQADGRQLVVAAEALVYADPSTDATAISVAHASGTLLLNQSNKSIGAGGRIIDVTSAVAINAEVVTADTNVGDQWFITQQGAGVITVFESGTSRVVVGKPKTAGQYESIHIRVIPGSPGAEGALVTGGVE